MDRYQLKWTFWFSASKPLFIPKPELNVGLKNKIIPATRNYRNISQFSFNDNENMRDMFLSLLKLSSHVLAF